MYKDENYMKNWQEENREKINKYNKERRKKVKEELKDNKIINDSNFKTLKPCVKQTNYSIEMMQHIKKLAFLDDVSANDIIRSAVKNLINERKEKGDL